MRQSQHECSLASAFWPMVAVVVGVLILAPSPAQADTEWEKRLPPALGYIWSFQPAQMPQICEHFRDMPRGRGAYVGTSIPPGASGRSFLIKVLQTRAPGTFNYGCKSALESDAMPDVSLVDMNRRVVVMESTILQEEAIDAYRLTTLELPEVEHRRGRAIRVSYPSSDPDALLASFERICGAKQPPRYCTYISRMQVRGTRVEVDTVYNRSKLESVRDRLLDDAGWGVDATSEPLSARNTSAAQAFLTTEAGLAVYASADGWLRHRLSTQIVRGANPMEREEDAPYWIRARQVLSMVYERALMDDSEREVYSQALLATADPEALTVDAVQTLTEYGHRVMMDARGPKPEPQRGPEVAIAGEFAVDVSALLDVIRPARWLTQPFERRPRDEQVAMLLKKVDEHSRKFYLDRGNYNPIFHRLDDDSTGPPDETWFTMLFQPMSTIAGALEVNRRDAFEAGPVAGIRGLSIELGLALYRDVPLDLEVVVESGAGDQIVAALSPFVRWYGEHEPEYFDRAKIAVDAGQTRISLGEPTSSKADPLADAEMARVTLNLERLKAQFEVMRSAGAAAGELSRVAPYVASVLCPNPHDEYGCALFGGRLHRSGNQAGFALLSMIHVGENMAVSLTADEKTRVFRLVYGRADVAPPSVPESPAEPVDADLRDGCEADAMWAAADLMSRDILGMYKLVDVLEVGRGRRSQLLMGRRLRRQVVEFSVEDMEKAQAKYLEKRRDVLVGELDAILERCEADSAAAQRVGDAIEFWKDWSPSHEFVGYKKK